MAETGHMIPRESPKKMRVTFPDGEVICYKRVVNTFIDTIKKIGPERVASLGLEVRHHPLVSREKIALFKDNSRPIDDEWYVITESDTAQKYLQLNSISTQLGLGLNIEMAESFDEYEKSQRAVVRKEKAPLTVSFPDGDVFSEAVPRDTFLKAIAKIGPERLAQKGLVCLGRQIVTRFKKYPNQIEVARNQWVTIYSTTADKVKGLKYIKDRLDVDLTCSME